MTEADDLVKAFNDGYAQGKADAVKCAPTADVQEVRHIENSCDTCKYSISDPSQYPCSRCTHCYTDKYVSAKMDGGWKNEQSRQKKI